jgi:hypothetical protein
LKSCLSAAIGIFGIQTFSRQGRSWDMAQTRRMGMQKERAQLPKAPRFSPYLSGVCGHAELQRGINGSKPAHGDAKGKGTVTQGAEAAYTSFGAH